jgi:dihydropteroate synthase
LILARDIGGERPADLELAFARMGLPLAAGDYLREKLPHFDVLLTGLSQSEARFLRRSSEESAAAPELEPRFVSGDPGRGTGLLSGRREQLQRLVARCRQSAERQELATALERVLSASQPPRQVKLGSRTLQFGRRTHVMGVINVTPDSFSDGGEFLDPEKAIAHGMELVASGADILDVGGESTRPGAAPVSVELELKRVLAVVRALHPTAGVPISVDTRKALVAREALAAGAAMVNDVSGSHFDPELLRAVAEAGASCCLMHIQGTPETMQRDPRYLDVMEEVISFLHQAIERAVSAGVDRSRIFVDPGIGFGKTLEHNLFLLRRLRELRWLGLPILVGTSRKAFLGAITQQKNPGERLIGTVASVAAMAINGGADVVRVHDVAEAKQALDVAEAIRNSIGGGELFSLPGQCE